MCFLHKNSHQMSLQYFVLILFKHPNFTEARIILNIYPKYFIQDQHFAKLLYFTQLLIFKVIY
jgi:hypothetical protein